MKNFTYLFGLTSAILTIVGSLFKRMHWPGAGILITVGLVLIVLVFLPLFFITSYREQAEKKNPVYAIVGYLTLAFLLSGAVFKIMHWPGAGVMIYTSVGFLLVGFVPLYVVNVFQRSGQEKTRLPYIVMLLVGISMVMLFSNINMSRNLMDVYLEEAIANNERVEEARERTAKLIELAHDSTFSDKIQDISKIHDKARELQLMINEMQEWMKAFVNEPGKRISDVQSKDNRRAGREAIINSGIGWNVMLESRNFKEMLFEVISDPLTRSQIDDHLEFTGTVWQYEFGGKKVRDAPLMKNYYKNTDAAKGIALAEYVAISYLLHP